MSTKKCEITILMLEKYGGFLNAIPKGVNVKYLEGYSSIKALLNEPPKTLVLSLMKEQKVFKGLYLLLLFMISKYLKQKTIIFNHLMKNIPDLKNEYDIAVAYAGPMDFISYFVAKKIKAKKKIQWIHFDITKIGFNKQFATKIYKQFDNIYVVSKEAKKKLLREVPTIKDKTDVFLNMVSLKEIHHQSQNGEGFNDGFTGLRILTVGRLTDEKGQDIAIKVLARLMKDGYKTKWYCLGEGSSRTYYESLIAEHNLKDHFILLGSNPNPYPFINQCDIYVQPSRYEGYSISLIEARTLKKPIITTNVNGSNEQIIHGETGIVVNIDEDELYHAVAKLLSSHKFRNQLSANLAIENSSPKVETEKLKMIFN
jgi:glycosyltransferase involved in cell wall biosynthesis